MKRVRDVDELAGGWVSLFSTLFTTLPLSFSLPVYLHKGSRGLTFTSARVLVSSTNRWPRLATHRRRGPRKCVLCAQVPALAVQPPHVCHRQRDSALSVGSHMPQDMGVSEAPPHLGGPFPLCDTRHVRKPLSKKWR